VSHFNRLQYYKVLQIIIEGYLQDQGTDGKIILEWILGKKGGKVCSGCIWFRIGTSGRLL